MPNKSRKKINLRNKKSIKNKKGGSAVERGYGRNQMVNSVNTTQPQIPIINRGEIINPFNKPEKVNSEHSEQLEGGKRKISNKKGGNRNIPVDINTKVPALQQWTNPKIHAPLPQYQGGIYTGPQAYGPWGVIPVTPTTSNMIHKNLVSSSPPPGANVQYQGTNHLGNNFSSMPGVSWYNNTTEMNPGQFRIKGTPCTQTGGKRTRNNRKKNNKRKTQNKKGGRDKRCYSIQKENNDGTFSNEWEKGCSNGEECYDVVAQKPVAVNSCPIQQNCRCGTSLENASENENNIGSGENDNDNPSIIGGQRKKGGNKRNNNKKGGNKNIPIDIKTNVPATQQWTNPNVAAPAPQYQGGIYTGPQAYGPWGFIPVTPTTSNMIHNNLRSANPPPGATVQYPGTNRLGNNFSAMPGVSWYNNTTEMNPGQFRIKGTPCTSKGGKKTKSKKN